MVESGLLAFLAGGSVGGLNGLSGLSLGHALLEFVNASGGIDELLLAGIKRVTDVADADEDGWPGGSGFDHITAGAPDFGVHVFRMSIGFHNKGPIKYQGLTG